MQRTTMRKLATHLLQLGRPLFCQRAGETLGTKPGKLTIGIFLSLFLLAGCSSKEKTEDTQAENESSQTEKAEDTNAQSSDSATKEMGETLSKWSYTGPMGPQNWSNLSPSYSLCQVGQRQSPIDLKWAQPVSGPDFEFSYSATPYKITRTDNLLTVEFQPGNILIYGDQKYDLYSAEFHTSSEHTLSGNALPMEVQLFHRGPAGETLAVGVILIEGTGHAVIKEFWEQLPKTPGTSVNYERKVDISTLIPVRQTHYSYKGSLTRPPCTESVHWLVLNTPVTLSRDQISRFRQFFPNNSRPIQALNGRKVVNH